MDPFLGELRMMSFGFAPRYWAQCNGQLLPIPQNQELFSLLGVMYGGDGKSTFGLPDLRGRAPIHFHPRYPQGLKMGQEFHTLTEAEIPRHNHFINASKRPGSQPQPAMLAQTQNVYRTADEPTPLHEDTLLPTGGGEAHENRPPFQVTNWCIALKGLYPSKP